MCFTKGSEGGGYHEQMLHQKCSGLFLNLLLGRLKYFGHNVLKRDILGEVGMGCS